MTAALSELLATLATATGGGLDYLGGLFALRRRATIEYDPSPPGPMVGTYSDVEADVDYRKRITAAVKEAAERAAAQDNARINASARLHRAVEHAMVALYARCNLVPATVAGYEMVRNEIACALGDLRNGAVKVEAQPPGFYVTWNGVDCTWLGMKTTTSTQRMCRFCDQLTGRYSEYRVHAFTDGVEHFDRFDVCHREACAGSAHQLAERTEKDYAARQAQPRPRIASVGIVDRPPNPECMWSTAAETWSASNERVTLYNPPDRPDGFAQAAVDAAKAVLLAPAKKRGAR